MNTRSEPVVAAADVRMSYGDVEIAGLADAVERLKALSRPYLDWAGKAERLSFDVPTLPLFGHERLSTKAILETLKGHERDRQMELQLFADLRDRQPRIVFWSCGRVVRHRTLPRPLHRVDQLALVDNS